MSLYEWSLTTQAHQRNQLRRDQRALMVLNAWTKEPKTLSDLHGGTREIRGGSDALKEQVMERKGINKDLSQNRL